MAAALPPPDYMATLDVLGREWWQGSCRAIGSAIKLFFSKVVHDEDFTIPLSSSPLPPAWDVSASTDQVCTQYSMPCMFMV